MASSRNKEYLLSVLGYDTSLVSQMAPDDVSPLRAVGVAWLVSCLVLGAGAAHAAWLILAELWFACAIGVAIDCFYSHLKLGFPLEDVQRVCRCLSEMDLPLWDESLTPLVGRAEEMQSLITAVDTAIADRSPVLVTVIGSPSFSQR